MAALLSRADRSVGRLDGLAETLPNPDLFVAMYVRREAVLSSQIEGTQSTVLTEQEKAAALEQATRQWIATWKVRPRDF
jgi:Fic family protein